MLGIVLYKDDKNTRVRGYPRIKFATNS